MNKHFKLAILALFMVGMMAGGFALYGGVIPGVDAAGSAGKTTSPVMDYHDHGSVVMNPQQRGTSDLVRKLTGVSMNIDTTDLPIGSYTVWWVIFNNPGACSDGVCGANDTGKAADGPNVAEGGVLWATGGIVGPDRMGHFSSSLGLGVDAAPGPVLRGPGLTDPLGAEIHLVVRYHGPTDWSDPMVLGGQITTVNVSCDTFKCFDPQVTAHK